MQKVVQIVSIRDFLLMCACDLCCCRKIQVEAEEQGEDARVLVLGDSITEVRRVESHFQNCHARQSTSPRDPVDDSTVPVNVEGPIPTGPED